MQKIAYNQARLLLQLIGCSVMGVLALLVALNGENVLAMIGVFLFGWGAVMAMRTIMRGTPALIFDGRGVTVNRYGRAESHTWDHVQDIRIHNQSMRMYGVVPINSADYLVIAVDGGVFGTRKLSLPASVLDLRGGGLGGICGRLLEARQAALGTTRIAMMGAPTSGWGRGDTPVATVLAPAPAPLSRVQPNDGFDADEVINRYLASRQAEQASAPVDPAPLAAAPTRPSFGRRTG